jgi:hypothetical protein
MMDRWVLSKVRGGGEVVGQDWEGAVVAAAIRDNLFSLPSRVFNNGPPEGSKGGSSLVDKRMTGSQNSLLLASSGPAQALLRQIGAYSVLCALGHGWGVYNSINDV